MKKLLLKNLKNLKKSFYRILFYMSKKPGVYSIDETLNYINDHHSSVSRFGDGEFLMLLGYGNGFQRSSKELSARLQDTLNSNLENHIVCISDIWGDISFLKKQSIEFSKKFLRSYGYPILKKLDCEKTYFNAFFTRPYDMFVDKSKCETWFEKNKKIWEGKNVLIVEGEKSRLGVGNDLFDSAFSVERLLCPSENAFEKYTEILEHTMAFGRDKLILIALGMTATVLAYDLAQRGFWAIDIGHIDVEYEWFLKKAEDKMKIDGKYVNEAAGGNVVDDESIDLDKYKKEVVYKIL